MKAAWLGFLACLALAGCRDWDAGNAPAGTDVQVSSPDCRFSLCQEPIPDDSAGLKRLADRVADSALAEGLSWLRATGGRQRLDTASHWIKADSLAYSLGVERYGLFPRLNVFVLVKGATRAYAQSRFAIAGQNKSLAGFPALGRLDYDGGFVLAERANVYGPILIWRGGVAIASDFYTRYEGQTPKPVVWKSENPLWKTLPFTFPGAIEWFAEQDSVLQAAPASLPGDDTWFSDTLVGKSILTNITLTKKRMVAPSGLVLGEGCVLNECMIIASQVRIQGNARIGNSLVFGRDSLIISGAPSLTGQFLSRDTLYLNADSAFTGYPIFYVHGNPAKNGGSLRAARARGEAILLYGGNKDFNAPFGYHMLVDTAVNIKGLIYANGNCTMDGTLQGSALMERNMYLHEHGTTYVGFIRRAQLSPPDPAMRLPLPLLIDPFEETVIRSSVAELLGTR